jgi:beta-lactamase regulating signal transducer with metallopeptidase domain
MITKVIFYLLNAGWQALAIFLLGAAAARLMRRTSAALEYLLWVAILLAACLAPLLSLVPFGVSVAYAPVWQPQAATDFGLWLEGGARTSSSGPGTAHRWLPMLLGAFAIYGIFVLVQFARLGYGLLQVRRIIAGSHICRSMELPQPHPQLQQRLAKSGCVLRISDAARVPFAFGFAKLTIVLPRHLVDIADDERLTAVLAHELAHVRRRDWLVNIILLALSTPLSFHPCIALIRRRVEACREAACDEAASGFMTSNSLYARALLDLAGTFAKQQLSLAAAYKGAALGVLDGSTLEDRIRRLMDPSPRLSTKRARLYLLGCLAVVSAASVAITSFALTVPANGSNGSVAGVWTGQFTDPHGPDGKTGHTPIYLRLAQSGAQITGVIGPNESGAVPIQTAQLTGDQLHMTTSMSQGQITVSWTLDLTLHGNQMSGSAHAVRSDQHSWDVQADLSRQQ